MKYHGPEDNGDNDDDSGETNDEVAEGVGEVSDSDNSTDPHGDLDSQD